MDFIFALDKLRNGYPVQRPGLYGEGKYLRMSDGAIITVAESHLGDEVLGPWPPTQEAILATDWYPFLPKPKAKPPSQGVKAAGFVDSVVKGL